MQETYGTEEGVRPELEVFGIIGAVDHEVDRVEDFLGSLASEISPFLMPINSKPMPEHPPKVADPDHSEVVRRLMELRERVERMANSLLTLKDRIR